MAEAPDKKKKLWRYMPLISLLDFLQTGELRLSRADTFEDVREGHVGLDAMLEHVPDHLHTQAKAAINRQNRECYITCWHLAHSESLAMWRVYGNQAFSIALVSNVGRVMSVCHDYTEDLSSCGLFGEVLYENYFSDGKSNVKAVGVPFGYRELPIPSSVLILFTKAKAFEYEQEWRLVIHKRGCDELALRVPVGDLTRFIDAIYVSPEARDWMVETVRHLVWEQFGLPDVPVDRSPLSAHFGR